MCIFSRDGFRVGKTYTGGEKLNQLGAKVNIVVCQKSKISDWIDHFESNYKYIVYDLTKPKQYKEFFEQASPCVGIINYELIFRRNELLKLKDFTLMLDESSLICNEKAKRTKFILKLKAKNIILLSGSLCGGKYEKLYSQLKLLGMPINKKTFYNMYVNYHIDTSMGFPFMVIDGYKNIEHLKRKMNMYGCHFLKTDEVIDLPQQIFTTIKVPMSKEYRKFRQNSLVEVDGKTLIGDNALTKMLCMRQLCGQYSKAKLEAFKDLVESTEDRLIVFYNFTEELERLKKVVDRPISIVNGSVKDLTAYTSYNNSISFIQYQAGAKGLNLQKANKLVYYSPTFSCDDYMQSAKRIHRLGQDKTCFYYKLVTQNSIEEKIYSALDRGVDYTDYLFLKEGG